MAQSMKDFIKKAKNTGQAYIHGVILQNMLENGLIIGNIPEHKTIST